MIAMFFAKNEGCIAAAIVEECKRDEMIKWFHSEGFAFVRERKWDKEKWNYADE